MRHDLVELLFKAHRGMKAEGAVEAEFAGGDAIMVEALGDVENFRN